MRREEHQIEVDEGQYESLKDTKKRYA